MTLLSNNCISQLLGTANSSDYLASFYCLLVDAPLYNMATSHRLLMYAMEREKESLTEKSGTKLGIELKIFFLSIVILAPTNL